VLGDQLPRRTLGLLGAGLTSTAIVFMPSLLGTGEAPQDAEMPRDDSSDHQPETLLGDCIALATGLCLALYVTFIRYCSKYRTSAAIDAAPSLGNFLAAAIALVMSTAFGDGLTHGISMAGFLPVVMVNAFLVAIFYVGFTLAPRYITGAEVALILLMETVCGPLWVFLRFGDVPSAWTIAGGAVLVVALAIHEVFGMAAASAELGVQKEELLRMANASPVIGRLSSSPPRMEGKKALPISAVPLDEGRGGRYQCFS